MSFIQRALLSSIAELANEPSHDYLVEVQVCIFLFYASSLHFHTHDKIVLIVIVIFYLSESYAADRIHEGGNPCFGKRGNTQWQGVGAPPG